MAEQTIKPRVDRDRRLVVGIDPDLVKSGVAIVEQGALTKLYALTFHEIVTSLASELKHEGAIVIIEDVEADSTTYHRAKTNARQHARIAQNVGQVKGVKRVLVECLLAQGINVVQVKPLRGPVKNRAKKDAEYFNKVTGWTGRTNEDKRDAAMLALWG